MCGRYRLKRHWEQDLLGKWRYIIEKVDLDAAGANAGLGDDRIDVRPTDLMPIIRAEDEDHPMMEMRRWGFLRLMPGVPDKRTGKPKLVRKQLFNAKSETAAVLPTFKQAFVGGRCLVPMSSWYEWPELPGPPTRKQRVEISRLDKRTMFAAGLVEVSKDFRTGQPVETFVVLTTKPNEFLGTVHDRAPLILQADDFEAWLFGTLAQAQALCGIEPDTASYEAIAIDEIPAPAKAAAASEPQLF
jgi:putative SOS response-associated peptidase YedK